MSHANLLQKKTLALISNPLAQTLFGTLFITLFAHVKIPLPFTPVPITGQTFAILFVGGTLGRSKGMYSVLLYLLGIGLGLPFVSGGTIEPLLLFGPKGGYCLGFALEAYLIGLFTEKYPGINRSSLFFASALSLTSVLLLGGLWLSFFVGFKHSFAMGIAPFIPGEIMKCLLFSSTFLRSKKPS